MRRPFPFLLALPLAVAGCGEATAPEEALAPSPSPATAPATVAEGTFQIKSDSAITYAVSTVPAGATARVTLTGTVAGARVRLEVAGMKPDRAYGAHLHTAPCAPAPDAAGPHYQHEADPSKPSVDPAYANPENEFWLDFTTDATGAATSESAQTWTPDPARPPRSLIVHAEPTKTAAGKAGTAGARVACLTLPA